MPGWLVERDGVRVGAVHVLAATVTIIGRAEDAHITVASEHVSRYHAQIEWNGAAYMVEDRGSKNGTYVNGMRITAPHELRHGDVITVPHLTLMFDAGGATITWSPERFDERALAPGLHVDLDTTEVFVRGRPVVVTAKEFLALALLYTKGGALVSKQELAAHVWPEFGGAVADSNIDQIIFRLRRKLEEDPERPRHLVTMRGLGYRLIIAPEP